MREQERPIIHGTGAMVIIQCTMYWGAFQDINFKIDTYNNAYKRIVF